MSKRRQDSEAGNAMVEFLGLGFMLMVPSLYFLLAVFALQSGSMAAAAASQQAVQLVQVQQAKGNIDSSSLQTAAAFAAADYGVSASDVATSVSCTGDCKEAGSVTVSVTVSVQVPLIPFIESAHFAQMTSSATAWGGKYQ